MRFDELYLSDDILDAIDAMHFEECTPIQERTIPLITEGKDLIAVAQTGTGKTAAYLLPVIDEIANGDYPQDAINCIVMAPTRELAQQIDQQMQGFAYYMPVSSVAIYGGTDGHTFEQQKKGLKLGADVVIATPGRLIAHISMGYVDLSKVSFLILDEADRMLDMGFYEDIMQIVKQLPTDRQTLLFSATMPPKIKQLSKNILRNPAEVKLSVSKPADKIDQSAYICYETQKIPILRHVFKTINCDRSIVFASSKLKCKELSKTLRGLNLSVGEMHSDLDQSRREEMLLAFKSGKIKILVATDIMARGIDIDDIGLVVNYDVPHENEDYVHRVGRTARANTDGIAITFVSEREIGKFKRIEQFIEKEVRKNEIPEEIGEGPEYIESKGRGGSRDDSRAKGKKDDRRKGKKDKKRLEEPKTVATEVKAPAPSEEVATPEATAPQEGEKKKRRRKKRRKKSPATEGLTIAAVSEQEQTPETTETTETQYAPVAQESEAKVEEERTKTEEPVAEETPATEEAAADGEKKKKQRRKKKKGAKKPEEVKEDEEVDLGPDPYGDRPISYSIVSAMMAAEARERAAREAAERDARTAALKKAAEEEQKTAEEKAAVEEVKVEEKVESETSATALGEGEVAEKPKKRAPCKKTTKNSEPAEPVAEEATSASEATPVDEVEEKSKKRTTRKKATKKAEPATEDTASVAADQVAAEAETEEKPKKRTTRKKAVKKVQSEQESTESASASPEAEEKLKKRTTRKKSVKKAETPDEPLATADSAAPAAEVGEKPKKSRAPRKKAVKKAEEPLAESQD